MLNKAMNSPWGMTFEPPFQAGDVLWVRETWTEINGVYIYRADDEIPEGWHLTAWRPSIFMPKEAARLFLRVVDVRAERLQSMSAWNVVAEGVGQKFAYPNVSGIFKEFQKVWDATLKPSELNTYGWDADPWVWAVTFRRCEKPEGWWS
jgi:hypothetical protein